MPDFAVIPGTGLTLEVDDGTGDMVKVGRITSVNLGDGQTTFTDVSDFDTVKNKEYVPGIKNLGKGTVNFIFDPADEGQLIIKAMAEDHVTRTAVVTFPDIKVLTFDMLASSWSLNAAGVNDNKITGSFAITHTGDIVYTDPA